MEEYNDDTIIDFGKYAGRKLANIPSTWFLYLYYNPRIRIHSKLKKYIEDNMEVLQREAEER